MKALVLGGSGFIGTNLCKQLITRGMEITVYDKKENALLKNAGINFVAGNFDAYEKYAYIVKGHDIVYHLISSTIPASSGDCFHGEISQNIEPTIALMDACVQNKCRLVFVSSGGTVYGKVSPRPIAETDPTNPICHYGVQKLMIEKYLYLYHHLSGLDYKIIRLSNPYGPYQIPNSGQGALTTFVYNAIHHNQIVVVGEGNIIRDYIFIEDAVSGIIDISLQTDGEKIYNLGSGVGYSLNEIIDKIELVTGEICCVEHIENRNVDVPYNVLDIGLFQRDFGKVKFVGIEEGIGRLADFFRREI